MKNGFRPIVAFVLALAAVAAHAQPAYPEKPVRIIVGFPAGVAPDIAARILAEKLSEAWGKPVVVENVSGAGGNIGADRVAKAVPDGYTLGMVGNGSLIFSPGMYDKLPFDPVKDFAPVAQIFVAANALVVPVDSPIKSLPELVAMARAQPGKLNWASVTGATDLVIAAFLKREGLDMAKIPYRDPVQALNDVAEGRLQFYWSSLAIVRGAIDAGRIKLLAITSSAPSSIVPGVMTATQAGFPGLTFDGLVGFYGTRDMPSELREKIATDVRAALADPVIVDRLQATGQEVVPGSAAEFAADIEKQHIGAAENAKVLGIKAAR